MKACYIFQLTYPWDIRVEKIMDSLTSKGIEGHIISRNSGLMKRRERVKDNLYIHRLPAFSNKLINTFVNFPAFFSPFWINEILQAVRRSNVDLLIIRDLPLAPAALFVGRLLGIPVLMDMAEDYPEMIRDTWKYRGPGRLDVLIRNPFLLKRLEKFILPRLDGVLVVSEYSKERIEKLGVISSRIWVVSNTPRLSEHPIEYVGIPNEDEIRGKSSFIMLYVGGMEESRGLDVVIKALPEVHKIIPDAKFVVVGSGTSEAKLKLFAAELGVSQHVHFTGWMDNNYVPSIIKLSDVCIVPHHVTAHTNTTIPNKIFDYMLQKKPVIVTNSKAMSDIVLSSNCGKVYIHDDWEDLSRTIIELKDSKVRDRYGLNGYEAVRKRYNWSFDEEELFKAVSELTF